jgi:hypothetical protein
MKNVTLGAITQEIKTTTKIVDAKKLTKYERTKLKYETLKAKKDKTTIEIKSLINTFLTLEDKTPSMIFNKLKKASTKTSEVSEHVKIALGKSQFPTYQEFITKLTAKNKQWYSNWDGICVLTSFNKVAKTNDKVKKQNKKEQAK